MKNRRQFVIDNVAAWFLAVAECEQTLSCLQHRLLELGEDVQLIVS